MLTVPSAVNSAAAVRSNISARSFRFCVISKGELSFCSRPPWENWCSKPILLYFKYHTMISQTFLTAEIFRRPPFSLFPPPDFWGNHVIYGTKVYYSQGVVVTHCHLPGMYFVYGRSNSTSDCSTAVRVLTRADWHIYWVWKVLQYVSPASIGVSFLEFRLRSVYLSTFPPPPHPSILPIKSTLPNQNLSSYVMF